MKNNLIKVSLGLGSIATVLGVMSFNGEDLKIIFHLGSTGLFLGLMAVLTLLAAEAWKE